jgi:two-component system response regulator RegX3
VGDTKTLDVHVKRLRAKVEPDPSNPVHLVTVRGLGYKFVA